MTIGRTYHQLELLQESHQKLEEANARLVAENKRLLGKVLGHSTKERDLRNEIEALRATYELPPTDPETAEIRRLFPRYPFLQQKVRETFLHLWQHRKARELGTLGVPPYLSKYQLHLQLYPGHPNPPKVGIVPVFICHLKKQLLGTRLYLEKKSLGGWKLGIDGGDGYQIVSQPAVAKDN